MPTPEVTKAPGVEGGKTDIKDTDNGKTATKENAEVGSEKIAPTEDFVENGGLPIWSIACIAVVIIAIVAGVVVFFVKKKE